MINPELLELLVCPKCKGDLEYRVAPGDEKNGDLLCHACGLDFRVVDDIPNLIIEDATPISEGAGQ